jgi:hypothetical protein
VLVCLLASAAHASPAADLLFRGAKTSIGAQDREAIAKHVGLTLSKDKKRFVDEQGQTLSVEVRELYLNADRIPEVFVIVSGSTAMYGIVKPLRTRTRGFQDLQILGPGFRCPVWRWNGRQYNFSHAVSCS